MTGEDGLRWDRRYSERGPVATRDVALPETFRPFADLLPVAGYALDIACGAGTAAVWLALRGLHVHGCDASAVAIAQASDLAERCGVAARCRFDVVDLDGGLPDGPPADILLCNRFRDPRLDSAILARLADGGILAVSALSEVGSAAGAFRARPGELTEAFGGLDVISSGEGGGHAWLIARRVGTPGRRS